MIGFVGLGIGAGLVSALLFWAVTSGSPAGILLCYLAALPILIVALGWTHLLGLLAALVGAATLSATLRPSAGLAFAFGPALPAWALAYLALVGRPAARSEPGRRREGGLDWYPAGRLLFWVAVAGAFVALASAVALGRGDYGLFRDILRRVADALLHAQMNVPANQVLPNVAGVAGSAFVLFMVRIAPGGAGAVFTLALALNLYLAGRAVAMSGRLPRPWPDVPGTRMPPLALGVLAGGTILALGPGYASVAGVAIVGALVMAFALQGFAFLHATTRGRPGRTGLLSFAYVFTIFFGGTFLPLLALAGMVDTATPLRARLTRGPGPNTRPPA
jgi:hypothetical protein